MPDQSTVIECGESAPANASAAGDAPRPEPTTNTKRSPKVEVPMGERAAYTPNEFAALFGKQTVWAYRRIWANQVKVISSFGGRMLIPASEVKRIQGDAAVYVGRKKRSSKTDIKTQPAEALA